jgi:transposase-like protein
MQVYQREKKSVNGAIKVVDQEVLLDMASKGLLNLATELGMEAMRQIFEYEVEQFAGSKGKHDKERSAYRHGSDDTKVVLGGAKVSAKSPRVRTKGGAEIPLKTLAVFQNEDQMNNDVLAMLLAGVSSRKYGRTVGTGADACTSKSDVSRRFIAAMRGKMEEFFGRRIEGRYPAIMIDGMGFGKITVVAAMGIGSDGRKRMLGVIEGGSENSEVVKALLADLVERGLDPSEPRLYTIDGSKALAKAIKDTFGDKAVIQRCQVHKKRNVLSHLPESEKSRVGKSISLAYMEFDEAEAKRKLELVEREIRMRYPAAADSLHEGLDETLTVHKLKVPGLLRQTLASTNAIESANSVCAGVIRRVTNFKTGEAAIRQAAAGYMEAERGFRRIKGYRELPLLQAVLARQCGQSVCADSCAVTEVA